MKTVPAIIDEIIDREGRIFTNRAADRGGPTKFGVTQDKLSEWRRRPVSVDEVRNLTETEAREIYESDFIVKPGFLRINFEPLRVHAIDFGVNSGTARSIRYLQKLVGAKVDGVLGPRTADKVNTYPDQQELHLRLIRDRLRFLGRLVNVDRSQAENISGWINRVTEFMV